VFHHDPVCGKRINRNKAHIELEHEGETYLLCCPKCQSEFEQHPEKYVNRRSRRGSERRTK
jgi:YHS domain-containing protein